MPNRLPVSFRTIQRFDIFTRLTLNHPLLDFDYIKHWMVTDNKTGCRFITVDAYRNAVPFYIENGFRFMGEAEKKRYEEVKKDTIAMYFDLYQL